MRGHSPCVFTKYGMRVVKIMNAGCCVMCGCLLVWSTVFMSCLKSCFIIEQCWRRGSPQYYMQLGEHAETSTT